MKAAKPKPVQVHPYIQGESNHASLHPEFLCATCGYPKRNRRHDLPAVPAAVLAEEARRMGESSE